MADSRGGSSSAKRAGKRCLYGALSQVPSQPEQDNPAPAGFPFPPIAERWRLRMRNLEAGPRSSI